MDRQVFADTYTGLYHTPPLESAPATVLDLGCNIGLTAAHFCFLWPDATVVGVEMDHACAELARQNAPKAIIREHAVAGKHGFAAYDETVRSDSFALGHGETVVTTLTLEETITASFPAGYVDFVKMDVEGSEWEIFAEDRWVPMVGTLLVELHDVGTSPEIVAKGIAALEAIGFYARHHERHPQAVWAWK